jgi:hypothetical protein
MKALLHILLLSLALIVLSGCDKGDEVIPDQDPLDNNILYRQIHIKDTARFHFLRELYGTPSSLSVAVDYYDGNTGRVVIGGSDSKQPSEPFTFNWGDGTPDTEGFFAQEHYYEDPTRNYIVTVTSHYNGLIDSAKTMVRFDPSDIMPVAIPQEIMVSIPDHPVSLGTRLYGVSDDFTYFSDDDFTHLSREDLEYVLSVAAWIQYEFVNRNVYLVDGAFKQVVIRNPASQGLGSLWFTNPPSFVCDDFGRPGTVEYCALFHESGHGFTLNTPAEYYYGGRIDGSANAIYSESMAVIFSLAATSELLNHHEEYGIPDDLAFEIYQNGKRDYAFMTETYRSYLSKGKSFTSWNNWSSEEDDTFLTFLTIAYRFCYHAEKEGLGYMIPAQRMMKLLQVFNPDLAERYDQHNNSPEADTFRSTLMVSALSYAFDEDLREEFQALNFPVNDETFNELLWMVEE